MRLQCLLCILLEAAGEGQHSVQVPHQGSMLLLLLLRLLFSSPLLFVMLLLLLGRHLQQDHMVVPHNKPV
jgi:hypothetical protein